MFRRRKARDQAEVELPITPMLDMAFQLMVFFIFTYKTKAYPIDKPENMLPPKSVSQAAAKPDNPSEVKKPKDPSVKEPPPETDENLTIIVEARTAEAWKKSLKAALESPDPKKRITRAEYDNELKLIAAEARKKEEGVQPKAFTGPPDPEEKPPAQEECLLGTPLRISIKKFNTQTGKPEFQTILSEDTRLPVEKALEKAYKDLEEELQDVLRKSLKGEDIPEIEISNDDGMLSYQVMVNLDDICRTRYGVKKGPDGKFVTGEDKKVKLEKVIKRDLEKNYEQILEFNRISKILPKVLVEGKKDKDEPK